MDEEVLGENALLVLEEQMIRVRPRESTKYFGKNGRSEKNFKEEKKRNVMQ